MRTQDYLNQIIRFEDMIYRKREEIKRIDIMLCSIPGNSLDADRVQTSMFGDKMCDSVAKLVDSEKEVSKLMDFYIVKRNYIIDQIDKLPSRRSYMVLTDRYVQNKNFDEIASRIGVTKRRVMQLHGIALKEFEEKYGEEYLDNPTLFS